MNSGICTVKRCTAATAARGLCWKHYRRKRRHGSVDYVKRRYKMPHKCRYCGTTHVQSFYRSYKGVCKGCRKLKAIHHDVLHGTVT